MALRTSLPLASTETTGGTSAPAETGRGVRQRAGRLCRRVGLLPMLARMRGLLRDDLRILAYHRVLDTPDRCGFGFDIELVSATPDGFRRQMTVLRRHFHPLRFSDVVACLDQGRPLPPRSVIVTFDDGYDDNYRHAFPILRALDVPATFFVSTGHIDSGAPYAYDWLVHMVCTTRAQHLRLPELGLDMELPSMPQQRRALATTLLELVKGLDDPLQTAVVCRLESEWRMPRAQGHAGCKPMGWDHLREMQRCGMEIGSHGVGHRMLAKLPAADMAEEVRGSKRRIEEELGQAVQVLSYPVGGPDAFDLAVIAATREAGYRLACSYVSGTNRPRGQSGGDEDFMLRRLPVERAMDLAWFEAMLALPECFAYPSQLRHARAGSA